jgi:hypothetical protein
MIALAFGRAFRRGLPNRAQLGGNFVMSWQATIDAARKQSQTEARAHKVEPWLLPLARLRGQVGQDGIERATTQFVLDLLGVPQRDRRAGRDVSSDGSFCRMQTSWQLPSAAKVRLSHP